MQLHTSGPLRGELTVPGDKSISHRAVMFGALAEGTTRITGFLMGEDCLSTIDCFRKMGVQIDVTPEAVTVRGAGKHGLPARARGHALHRQQRLDDASALRHSRGAVVLLQNEGRRLVLQAPDGPRHHPAA